MIFGKIFMVMVITTASLWQGITPKPTDREVLVLDFEEFQQYLAEFGEKTLVINFWATWCVPCVKELPYFEEATASYDGEEVEVVLVSLDFSDTIDSRLIPFIEENNLQSNVILLDDPNANSWIDKVSPKWSGAIPATVIKRGNKEAFYEKSFHSFEELQQIIQPFLKS